MQKFSRFLIFGYPVEHSLSPQLYQLFVKQFPWIELSYGKQVGLLKPNGFEQQVRDFFVDPYSFGANITAPFKQRAFNLVDVRTSRAQDTASVNSIFKLPSGELEGDNTDGVGLVRDIEQNQNFQLKNKKILILGAGGAVNGVLPSLMSTESRSITVVNRAVEKAEQLKNRYSALIVKTYSGLDLDNTNYDLVINATPLSLLNQLPVISETILAPNALCYDMVYKPEYTVFTRWAEQHGCRVADGLGMLVEQGVENFYRWFGVRPETGEAVETLRSLQ